MEILSFEGSNGSSKRKRGNHFVAVMTIVALGFMGSTFAASVTLNSGSEIQYGQGLAQATACSNSLVITPSNHYVNAASSGSFYVDTITVVDTRTATGAGLALCAGDSIKLSAHGNVVGAAPLFSCTFSNITWTTAVGATVSNCPAGAVITSSGTTGLQLAFSNPASAPNVLAGNVYKFTVESF